MFLHTSLQVETITLALLLSKTLSLEFTMWALEHPVRPLRPFKFLIAALRSAYQLYVWKDFHTVVYYHSATTKAACLWRMQTASLFLNSNLASILKATIRLATSVQPAQRILTLMDFSQQPVWIVVCNRRCCRQVHYHRTTSRCSTTALYARALAFRIQIPSTELRSRTNTCSIPTRLRSPRY